MKKSNNKITFRLGTRKSALAMWQANFLKDYLEKENPLIKVNLIKVTTTGDRFLSRPLDASASRETGVEKGFFTKELEEKLLAGEIDAAIHSLKDLPTTLPRGLQLGAVSKREAAADILLTNHKLVINRSNNNLPDMESLAQKLKRKSKIGTASQRRIAQLGELFPQTEAKFIRGNVDTRIRKLLSDEFDAIILAEAGLKRLSGKTLFDGKKNLAGKILWELDTKKEPLFVYRLNLEVFLPACSQGFLGVEILENNLEAKQIISIFNDHPSRLLATAERTFLRTLEAGCHAPVGGYAKFIDKETMILYGKVLSKDGSRTICGNLNLVFPLNFAPKDFEKKAQSLGEELAELLLEKGAAKLLT